MSEGTSVVPHKALKEAHDAMVKAEIELYRVGSVDIYAALRNARVRLTTSARPV